MLALEALRANAKAFQKAARHAGLIVRENWPEIVREAQEAQARSGKYRVDAAFESCGL